MNFGSLALLFAFTANILLVFLAGLNELFTYTGKKEFIIKGMWDLWAKKGLFLFLWGLSAGVLGAVIPLKELFLPFFVAFFLILRLLLITLVGKKHRENMAKEVDRLISDPGLFIPVLIAGYTDISILALCLVLLCIWGGIGLAALILLSIRSQLELEGGRRMLMLLLSTSFMAMIFTALQQLFPFLPGL